MEQARSAGADSEAVAFIQIELEENGLCKFGAGIDTDTTKAAVKAIIAAINRTFVPNESVMADASSLLESEFHFHLPRRLRSEFNNASRKAFQDDRDFIQLRDLWGFFQGEFVNRVEQPYQFVKFRPRPIGDGKMGDGKIGVQCELEIQIDGQKRTLTGSGNGAIDACAHALRDGGSPSFRIADYHEHARSFGSDAEAAAYIEIELDSGERCFGVGIDPNTVTAAIKAVMTALNRSVAKSPAIGNS